jgi:hypothetical protein
MQAEGRRETTSEQAGTEEGAPETGGGSRKGPNRTDETASQQTAQDSMGESTKRNTHHCARTAQESRRCGMNS